MGNRSPTLRTGPLVAVVLIGAGLLLAPFAFQMFTRAPKGGRMIEQFRPYMTTAKIDRFRHYLAEIDAAEQEARDNATAADERFTAVAHLRREWPTINADMGDMLTTMRSEIPAFRGVSALPPFVLFPWFFALPGAIAMALGLSSLASATRGRPVARRRWALVVLGLGLLGAPAIFQMFTRAPGGAGMIDEFRPLMTDSKVTAVQGYFLVLGAAEGQLRNEVVPAVESTAGTERPAQLPAIDTFISDWPAISNEMAPMIGAMADNVENFAAVDALPPFWMFPWFFVVPGLLLAALALVAQPGAPRAAAGAVRPADNAPLAETTA